MQWNFNRNSNIFIQENTLENVVCKMAAILSRPQCVNGVLWSSPKSVFTVSAQVTILYDEFENDNFKCITTSLKGQWVSTLRPRHNGHLFPDDIFKWVFLNENVCISIKISLKFVPKGPINNILASVQITAWRCPGDKPLSEPMMVWLLTHICVIQPQWVNRCICWFSLFLSVIKDPGYQQIDGIKWE